MHMREEETRNHLIENTRDDIDCAVYEFAAPVFDKQEAWEKEKAIFIQSQIKEQIDSIEELDEQ